VQALLAGILLAAVALAGCAGTGATFAPDGPCVSDGRAPGTYPDLETKVPGLLLGTPSSSRDSGRSCSSERLGTLKAHSVTELRYAGATWSPDHAPQTVIAVFKTPPDAPPLAAAWMEEFYQAGAQGTSKTENIHVTRPSMPIAGAVWRLDTLNELSFQSVVVWPGDGLVHVVIVATQLEPGGSTRAEHDESVQVAVSHAVVPEPGLTNPPPREPVLPSGP
jgi:hypothetical protein